MGDDRKYKVIVSDKAKRMLGTHILFMAQHRSISRRRHRKRRKSLPQYDLCLKCRNIFFF